MFRLCRIRRYLKLHIEQGPALEKRGIQIGVVEAMQGISHNVREHNSPEQIEADENVLLQILLSLAVLK